VEVGIRVIRQKRVWSVQTKSRMLAPEN